MSLAERVISRFRQDFPHATNAGLLRLGQIIEEEERANRKAAKKATIDERARQIYDAYPRHIAPEDALVAISKALKKHEFEYLMDKTSQFAEAVKSWPSSYRYFQDGGDRCPYPASWFNAGRYADDSKEWRRSGARTPAPHQKTVLKEPEGWRERFPDYINRLSPWANLPESDQRFISQSMDVGNVLAHPIQELHREQAAREY